MTLFSEMASWWLRAAAAQMQYWQDASDKWQETVGKMSGMMPKVEPRDARSSLFAPGLLQSPWMSGWIKGAEANTPLGAWPMPVRDMPEQQDTDDKIAAAKPQAPVKLKAAPKPQVPAAPAAAIADEPKPDTGIPPLLNAAPATPDDLLLLKGVGPKILKLLNDLGIYTFAQIAAWTPEQIDWIESKLDFKGRVTRENWVAQAKTLSAQA